MLVQQVMDGLIMGNEGQAIGQFETRAVVQGAVGTDTFGADRRLVNHLQGQTWLDALGGLSGPTAQQIPGPQTQVFGCQQPDAGQVPADFVGQPLADGPFQTARIARLGLVVFARATGLEGRLIFVRTILIEFFFEGRIRQ